MQMTRLPEGFTNLVAIFEQIMSRVLGDAKGVTCENMVDNITVHAESRERDCTLMENGCRKFVWDHIQAVGDVLSWLKEANLTISVNKALFGVEEAELLGTVVHQYGRQLTQNRLDKIARWKLPTKV